MKKVLLTLILLVFTTITYAQDAPVDFEQGGKGADWTWLVFANGNDPALEIVDNPDKTGGNTSAKVAKFTALTAGDPWAGTLSDNIGSFLLNDTNRTIKIMVWKSVISDVGFKLETASGWSEGEKKVANTKTGEWEELTFDFSRSNNPPEGEQFTRITIFPDFNLDGRTTENIVYFDNVSFSVAEKGAFPDTLAPFPEFVADSVISIFGEGYDAIEGVDFPDWGQKTALTFEDIEDGEGGLNKVMVMRGLDYQGIQFNNPVDLTEMDFLHLHVWSENSTALNVYLINAGDPAVERGYPIHVPTEGWSTVIIPFKAFIGINLASVNQMKFDGNGDIFVDNILFFKDETFVVELPDTEPSVGAPVPTFASSDVISIFSNAYTNLNGTNLNPVWGQATQTSEYEVEGNNTLRMLGLNYQGIELGSNVDVSSMIYLHLDYWTANSTALQVFIISPGPVETPYTLPVPTEGWGSVDIPLSEFSPVDLTKVFQFKFVGTGDVFVDNLLFHKSANVSIENEETIPNNFSLEQNFPNPFNPSTQIRYSVEKPAMVTLEVYNMMGQKLATLVNGFKASGTHSITFNASSLASGMYMYRLTSGSTSLTKSMMLIK